MKIIVCICLCLLSFSGFSQTYEWAIGMGNSLSDAGNAIAVDDGGNVYSTGVFQGMVDFDPGSGAVMLTATGGGDAYVQKLDPSGALIWVKQIVDTGGGSGESLSLDGSGNVYITGGFSGTADFDPGPGMASFTTPGTATNIFVLKLDSSGNFAWVKHVESTLIGAARRIVADASGNVYSTGNFEGTADFDPGSGTSILTATGFRDAYIQKHDPAGNLLWVSRLENTSVIEGTSIASNAAGEVFVTGKFWGTADFDPGPGLNNLTAAGADDAFVLKLDASGSLLWVKQVGGPGYEHGRAMVLDTSGNICLTGNFQDTVDIDPGPGVATIVSLGGDDIFVLKLDSAGDFVWATQVGGSEGDNSLALTTDAAGNIYLGGGFGDTVDFDPGVGVAEMVAVGILDVFVLKLDASGNYLWAKTIGGAGLDFLLGLAIDDAFAGLYATGIFSDTVDFDPDIGTANLTASGEADIFVLKLNLGHALPIDPLLASPSLSVYPVPVTGQMFVEGPREELKEFHLYHISGQEVSRRVSVRPQSTTQMILDLSQLQPGMYILKTKNTINKLLKQ